MESNLNSHPKATGGSLQSAPFDISAPLRRIVTGGILFLLICVFAVSGYMAAGWRLDDALYMVVITIFGVGYGEVKPIESAGLRALTILVIVAGYGAVIYTVGGFMQMVVDGELNRAMGARRMTKGIERLNNHTIICGLGRLGTILARELHASNKPFVAIDADLERLQDAEERGYLVLHGDATEEEILEQAGIHRATTVAAVMSLDTTNVFVTITARDMNPSVTIIARGENPRTEKKLLGCGADSVVLPTAIGAHKIAQLITRPTAEAILQQIQEQSTLLDDLGHIGLQFNEFEVHGDSDLANQPMSEIEIRGNHAFLVVGIRHADGAIKLNPQPSLVLIPGDVVIVLGQQNDLPDIARRFMRKQPKMTYRGASV
ncbi:voltage-gated potassium channel [Neorhodopirellula lusitana]|uniref:Voltage-gated potassium channel n=1 Tax=Neorhodopirellula lusitana TaxID=445327 RepID=A0ABY1Q5R5_9BACT|nr:potassium channel protein [Neorhodopirellula lusitana]SMP59524.1 voltage-gated potassium channel [Neorhodopirellula lusitana]